MTTVFIAFGSNLSDPIKQAKTALTALAKIPYTTIIQCSPFYRTKPLGSQNQPDYLNAVIQLETTLTAEKLLDYTQQIEQDQGRVRYGEKWGPRTLDLDILLFGQQVIDTSRLTVPHYDLKNREFMLYPLYDIAPDCIFPDGTVLKQLLQTVKKNGMRQIEVPIH